jgi:HlyD family secretion protein
MSPHHNPTLIMRHTPRAVVILFVAAGSLLLSSCGRGDDGNLVLTGIMEANTVRVSAQTPGQVTDLLFDEGSQVAMSQRLATVETERLGYQIDQTRSATAELELQNHSAEAQYQTAIIQRDNVRRKHERFAALLKENAVTQQSVDDLKTQLDAAEEQVRAAALLCKTFQEKQQQVAANRNVLGKQVKDATILSPLEGTVLVRYIDKGELVATGTPVCEIADLRDMWTKVYFAEKDLASAKLGGHVHISVDGQPGKTFDGVITWISDRAEFTPKTILTEETRTTLVFPAKVSVKNPDGVFKIGMPITVSIPRRKA